MQILLIVVGVIVAVLVVLLLVAAGKPKIFRIQRSLTINAPPEKIAPLILDFHQWKLWSPYENLDPAMRRTYSGAPSGKGAIYNWDSDGKAGNGRMEILSADIQMVVIKLDFEKPFKANNTAEFLFVPQHGATNVTWAMFGPHPFMMRFMCLFMNVDKMVGSDFEKGLASLKAAAEANKG